MSQAELLETIEAKYATLSPYMDERTRRIWAAVEAQSLGWGGVSRVAEATGMSRATIYAGVQELESLSQTPNEVMPPWQIRFAGGGRKRIEQTNEGILEDLESLLDPVTRGDPESPLRWTTKSTNKLASELKLRGHAVSARTVYTLLKDLGYSLQSHRKTLEGRKHSDRDAQFQHIATRVEHQQLAGQPAISVDAKKRELIGEFYNAGQEWRPKHNPQQVNTHDFVNPELGKVIPYGVYDLSANQGWVSVGIDHNTAEFAVETIRRWW